MAERASDYSLDNDVEKAEAALRAAKAKVDRAGDKQLRILRARSVEEAEAIVAESEVDVNLKLLCQKRPGWKPLQEKGATDEQLEKFLGTKAPGWPEYRPYNNKTMPSAEVGYSGRASAWVDPDKGPEGNAHLTGQKLVDAVRRVMGIPKKAAPLVKEDAAVGAAKKKPAPKKPVAKKPTPKAPATKAAEPDAGENDEPAGARPIVQATPGQRPLTWGQWAATLRGIRNAINLDPNLPTKANATADEVYFLDMFRKGVRPSDARDAWEARTMLAEQRGPIGVPGTHAAPPKPQTMPLAEICSLHAPTKAAKPEVKRVSGKTRAQMNAILRQNGPAELERKRELHAPGCPSDAASYEKIAAILDRMYGPEEPKKPLLSVAALSKPQTPMPTADDESGDTAAAAKRAFETARAGGASFAKALDAGVKQIFGGKAPTGDDDGDDDDDDSDNPHPDAECRVCGCTENDCQECIEATGGPCRWVDDPIRLGDLCSRCKPAEYGQRVSGKLAGGGANVHAALIIGQGQRDGHDCFQTAIGDDDTEADGSLWVRKAGATIERDAKANRPDPVDTWDDPNVDGRGVFVEGVDEVWVRGEAKNDKAKIVIRVARGADGMYRTGHLLEFVGAQAWQADSDEPVRISGQAVESEAYAVKARAHILINVIKAAPGGDGRGGAWSAVQRATYNAAIKALEVFIAHHPACQPATTAAKLKRPKAAIA